MAIKESRSIELNFAINGAPNAVAPDAASTLFRSFEHRRTTPGESSVNS